LRKDAKRPKRIPIPEFDENDPAVKDKVWAANRAATPSELAAGMLRRARDIPIFG
jgi:hypothetical protein